MLKRLQKNTKKKILILLLLQVLTPFSSLSNIVYSQNVAAPSPSPSTAPSLFPTTSIISPTSIIPASPFPSVFAPDSPPSDENRIFTSLPEITPFTTITPTTSPTLVPTITDSLLSMPSAKVRIPLKFQKLFKPYFHPTESITAVVLYAYDEEIETALSYSSGENLDLLIEKESNVDFTTIRIPPSLTFKPGKYTLTVKDKVGNRDSVSFNWGNIAVNLDKSVYLPQETAFMHITLTDNAGKILCNQAVSVEIKTPLNTASFTTKDSTIKTNPDCLKQGLDNNTSDYQLPYQIPNDLGVYQVTASATVAGQNLSSEISFKVESKRPYTLERKTVNRILPTRWQRMDISLMVDEDFKGTISDSIPDILDIATPDDPNTRRYDQVQSLPTWYNRGSILGVSIPPLSLPFATKQKQTLGFGDNIADPLLKRIYSQFGLAGHDGIDFNVPLGTPILAADSGMVVLAGDGDYGQTVVIQHDWGKSYYGHLSKIPVTLAQKVKKGDEIALSGNTGLSTGAHLHFGIKPAKNDRYNGYYGKINPLPYLDIPDNQVSPLTYTSFSIARVKTLQWDVNIKKGEKITLGYLYKTPNDMSTNYLLGPITLRSQASAIPDTVLYSDDLLWQVVTETYQVSGAQFPQSSDTSAFTMLKIDPLLLAVPDDYPPQKAALNQEIKGQYSSLTLSDSSSFKIVYATDSAAINSASFTLIDPPTSPKPQITANKISWPNIAPSTDLEQEIYDGYVNQKITIQNDTAVKTFKFQFALSDNLSIEDYSGHMLVKDKNTQEEFFLLRFPQGIDAQENRIDYKYHLEGDTLTLYPNRAWQYERAVYPITIYMPINVIAWTEGTVQVGENCPDPACGKDGDSIDFRPAGWYWGTEERRQHVQVKVPKLIETERQELTATTIELPEEESERIKMQKREELKDKIHEISGLVRYGIDYTKLATPDQLKKIRDKNKKEFSPVLDARKNKDFIKKKLNPLLSVIPDNSRFAYKPPSKISLLSQLLKSILKPVIAQSPDVKTIGSASRNYTTIALWETGEQGTLTTEEQGTLYKDSTFTISATQAINGSTTTSSYFMHLTVAASERHNGTRATGVIIDCNSADISGINMSDDYTVLDWIDITRCNQSARASIITSGAEAVIGLVIQNAIVRDFNPATAVTVSGFRFGTDATVSTITIRNSIFYANGSTGTRVCVGSEGTNLGDTVTVQNVTAHGCTSGLKDNGKSTMAITNTIAMANTTDFSLTAGPTPASTQDRTISSDATGDDKCTGTCYISKTTANQFVSTTSNSENFHLKSGSDAINTGTNLSANFTNDIDNQLRPSAVYNPWDIGADEFAPTNSQLLKHGLWWDSQGVRQAFTF